MCTICSLFPSFVPANLSRSVERTSYCREYDIRSSLDPIYPTTRVQMRVDVVVVYRLYVLVRTDVAYTRTQELHADAR